jgi:hypothetical protein
MTLPATDDFEHCLFFVIILFMTMDRASSSKQIHYIAFSFGPQYDSFLVGRELRIGATDRVFIDRQLGLDVQLRST